MKWTLVARAAGSCARGRPGLSVDMGPDPVMTVHPPRIMPARSASQPSGSCERRPGPRWRAYAPKHLCFDKGYKYPIGHTTVAGYVAAPPKRRDRRGEIRCGRRATSSGMAPGGVGTRTLVQAQRPRACREGTVSPARIPLFRLENLRLGGPGRCSLQADVVSRRKSGEPARFPASPVGRFAHAAQAVNSSLVSWFRPANASAMLSLPSTKIGSMCLDHSAAHSWYWVKYE